MNNNKGFSLVELMVVVAIIGILASIAVPNFQRFQAKTRQSEAKSKLTAIYTSEKAFHAEWNFYYGSLVDIGVQLEGESRYHVGFTGTGGPGVPPINFAPTAPGAFNTTVAPGANFPNMRIHPELVVGGVGVGAGNCGASTGAQAPPNALTGQNAQFVAGAAGIIYEAGNEDHWTINERKDMCNNRVGFQ
ncbi:MAG: prepilin-type N-terminal cleavage/methylation domain-containing protein [Bdellovibrionales bacterium]|nr:prepilin-type N-terminal cleavage/methylation domain-containing protein [Bdellovibrionales bacterium]